jgi:hypothetical protein
MNLTRVPTEHPWGYLWGIYRGVYGDIYVDYGKYPGRVEKWSDNLTRNELVMYIN